MLRILLPIMIAALAAQELTLPPAERKKKFDELSRKAKDERRGSARTALARHQARMADLEKRLGIYDLQSLVSGGDSSRRVDIVLLSSGFSKADARKVAAMADRVRQEIVAKVEPFRSYPGVVNFHTIGIDDPPGGPAHVPSREIGTTLVCDFQRALEYAREAPAADLVVVMCNVSGVRATAHGAIITIDASIDMKRVFFHEMGHAFAGLRDEYVEYGQERDSPREPFPDEEDEEIANVSMRSDPGAVKWHYWVPSVWHAAHQDNALPKGHHPGCFEGADLFGKGVWRPESGCLMRSGEQYCVVCLEQVEKRFYRLISPIDAARPRQAALAAWNDETVTFEGDAVDTRQQSGSFRGFWYVDGRNVPAGKTRNLTTSLTVRAADLGPGDHEIALRVDFANARVRRDDGWLSGTQAWRLNISPRKAPQISIPPSLKAEVGAALEFEAAGDADGLHWETRDLPEGAQCDGARFRWTPRKDQRGGWRPRFVLSDGVRSVERAVEISVTDPADPANFRPVLFPMETVDVTLGEPLELPIEAVDVDGDVLVFSAPTLPEGAEIDPQRGVIRWKPEADQLGTYAKIAVEVWDGLERVKGEIGIVVEETAMSSPARPGLRSPDPDQRIQALRKTGAEGKSFLVLEALRLLRDRYSRVRRAAKETLDSAIDESLLPMAVKDVAPHAWHFTDDPEILQWLAELAEKGKGDSRDLAALKGALKEIAGYRRGR